MNLKRKPKSKSGRLLWAVRHQHILDVRFNVMNDIPTDPKVMLIIEKLTQRIQSRLRKEDGKNFTQAAMFKTFEVIYVPPRQNTAHTKYIDATTKRQANAIVKKQYGTKTKIISRRS